MYLIKEEYLNSMLLHIKNEIIDTSITKKYASDEYSINTKNLNSINIFKNDAPKLKVSSFGSKFSFNSNSSNSNDFENAVKLYESMNMNRVYASDPRIWTYLTHGPYFNYVKERHKPRTGNQAKRPNTELNINDYETSIDEEKKTISNYLRNTFFLFGQGKASKRRNALSRLWWAIELTHSPHDRYNIKCNNNQKYYYSEILINNSDLWLNLFERTFGVNPTIVFSIIDIIDSENLKTKEIKILIKKVNSHLSFRNLNHLSYNDIINQFKLFID